MPKPKKFTPLSDIEQEMQTKTRELYQQTPSAIPSPQAQPPLQPLAQPSQQGQYAQPAQPVQQVQSMPQAQPLQQPVSQVQTMTQGQSMQQTITQAQSMQQGRALYQPQQAQEQAYMTAQVEPHYQSPSGISERDMAVYRAVQQATKRPRKPKSIIPRESGKLLYLEERHNEIIEQIHWTSKVDRQDVIRTAIEEFVLRYFDGERLSAEGEAKIKRYYDQTHR